MDSHKREWFAERAKVLEYYANNIPDNPDDVKIIFHKPESGWIDTDVVVNNSDTFQFPISYAYHPFEDLIKWLENLAVNRYLREFGIRNSISLFHEVIIRNDAESVTSQ